MAKRPVKVNRNTSPQRRMRSARKHSGVMGIYPSRRGAELFWIPPVAAVITIIYAAYYVCSVLGTESFTLRYGLLLALGVLLLVGTAAAFIFLWKCPFCGCSLGFLRSGIGVCHVCRKRLFGRFKGRKM